MAGFDNVRRYLRLPSRTAARIRRDVDDELRLQIELRAEELMRAGMAPGAAHFEARRRFGDLDDAARYCAGIDLDAQRRRTAATWLSELRQDASHTLRMLRRTPAFAAATVLTLALATGTSTAVYGVLHAYLVRPMPFPDGERLVSLLDAPTRDRRERGPSLDGVDWRSVDSLFAATARWDLDGFAILGGPHAENVTGAWVSAGYFQTLGVRLALGRAFHASEYQASAPVAIISHGLWQRRFGADSAVIGSTITIHSIKRSDAATIVTVVGILPRDFWPIQWRESDVLRPLPSSENSMPAVALLAPGVSRLTTQQRVDAVVRGQIRGPIDSTWHVTLHSPLERHSAEARPVLLAVLGAALFMLLAACGSVAGALVSQTAARRHELALRLALGGSRWRLVRQLVTESVMLTLLAGSVGLIVAYAILALGGPLIEHQLGTRAPGGAVALRPTAAIMLLSIAVSGVAGMVVGLVPSLTLLRMDRPGASSHLLGPGRGLSSRGGAARVRRVLIAGQVAVAMVLLFGAGLMFRTVARMQSLRLGFRADGVVMGNVLLPTARYADSAAKRAVMERLIARIAQTHGVRGAAAVFPQPFGIAWRFPVLTEGGGQDAESAPQASVFTVSPDYFRTMGIGLRSGRTFHATDDAASPLVVVISEGLARRLAPRGDVIGRRIRVRVPYAPSFDDVDERPWRTVVGVVSNTEKEFAPNAPPDVYVPYAQNPRSVQAIVVRADRPEAEMFEPLRRAAAGVDPDLALSGTESLADVIAEAGGQRRGLTALLGVFALFALGLSALALYASLSYTVVQRRPELAVRMALGADAPSVLRLVVDEAVVTAGIGVAVGALASLTLGGVLRNQVYGVGTADPATLIAISIVLTAAAVAACIAPALRAVRIDPALVLRE